MLCSNSNTKLIFSYLKKKKKKTQTKQNQPPIDYKTVKFCLQD